MPALILVEGCGAFIYANQLFMDPIKEINGLRMLVIRLLGPERALRAANLLAEGDCQNLKVDSTQRLAHAVLRVGKRSEFRATAFVTGDSLRGQCSCGTSGSCCVHLGALALALADELEKDLGKRTERRTRALEAGTDGRISTNRAPAAPVLPPMTMNWLSQLTDAAAKGPRAASAKRVVYAMEVRQGRVLVRCLLASTNGRGRQMAAIELLQDERLRLDSLDQRALRELLMFATPKAQLDYHPRGNTGQEALRYILATGRAQQGLQGPALAIGPQLSATIEWRLGGQGYHSCLRLPSATAQWCLDPAWYIDTATRLSGPLDLGCEAAVAKAILAAPPLDPSHLGAIRAHVLKAGLTMPSLPLDKPQRVAAKVTPKPILTLFSLPARMVSGGVLDLARVSFAYGDHRVNVGDPLKAWIDLGTELVEVQRNQQAEKRAFAELAKLTALEPWEEMIPSFALDIGVGSSFQAKSGDLAFPDGFYDGGEACFRFITEGAPALVQAGWSVQYERSFRFRLHQPRGFKATVTASDNDWFELSLGIDLDGKAVDLLPVLVKALAQEDGTSPSTPLMVPLPNGEMLAVPRGVVQRLTSTFFDLHSSNESLQQLRLPRSQAVALLELERACGEMAPVQFDGGEHLRELAQKLQNFHGIAPAPLPTGLKATLRDYQKQGLDWLQFLREHDLAGVLADDMGLGKTIQVIAHVLLENVRRKCDQPCLVVAPTSVIWSWQRQVQEFAPELRVQVWHGSDRSRDQSALRDMDLLITSYPLLTRDAELLTSNSYHLAVLDEAQVIKNASSKVSAAARRLKARHRLCLTGTPVENHMGELWALFDFLMPGFLGKSEQFRTMFRNPIERGGDDIAQARRASLRARVGPFLLRRTKQQVAAELPAKSEILREIQISGRQRELYESVRIAVNEELRHQLARHGIEHSHIHVLDALLKLRQVCCDPRLVKIKSSQGANSAKLEALMEMLPELLAEGRRILLFSQFTSMLALIEQELAKAKTPYVLLTGDTKDRVTPVQQFQEGKVALFLISLKAGGVGLNLTAADTVIHYDPWWNPAVEDQATDRAHRIGQDKGVFVYKLIAKGTVEESIVAMQSKKRGLVESLIGSGSASGLSLTRQDLDVLFAPLT